MNNLIRLLPVMLVPAWLYASYFADGMRAYKQGDYEKAKQFFELAAEEDGALQANYFLGLLYLKGKGTGQNLSKAEKYLHTVATMGNARAKCYLAEVYLLQKGDRKKQAIQLLREGHQEGADECAKIAGNYNIPLKSR